MKVIFNEVNDLDLRILVGLNKSVEKVQRKLNEDIRKKGMTTPQFNVLKTLYRLENMRVCEIIQKTFSTGGNMTVIIDNLHKLGYIKKTCCPDDKRSTLINITKSGREKVEEIFPEYLKTLEEILKSFTEDEKKTFEILINKLERV
ncbi:MAG: MarR family transcriptional regulator, and catechol-resistance regulon repressor [Kosmotogales bacterium]|nr:MarR family transcriptional regulator, and catechol-resistance regulon repressor [Kosmotogales bacterium]